MLIREIPKNMQIRKFVITVCLVGFAMFSTYDVIALQQVAGPIVFELEPGTTKTMYWGLVSDSDKPITLEIKADGKGSELLSFSKTLDVEPRQFANVEITVTVPADYPNDVKLTPSIYAVERGETGGATVLNIQMRKVLTLIIGNPVDEEIETPETPEPQVPPSTPEPQKPIELKPSQPLQIKDGDIDPEPQPDPAFTQTQSEMDETGGGCLIATAAHGSEFAVQIQQLREVRDGVVFQTNTGASFMGIFNQFYYSFSPTVADWERQSPVFKELVKGTITPMLLSLSVLNYVDIDSEIQMLGYGIGIIALNVGMYIITPVMVLFYAKRIIANRPKKISAVIS